MTATMNTLVVPVRDVDAAKRVFGALLGAAPTTDQPWYVGWSLDGTEIGLDPNGHARGLAGPVVFWTVPDVAAAAAELQAGGATVHEEPHDVGGGKLVAVLTDADGNQIGLAGA